jgi:signal transduction histidine kinase
MSRLKSFWSNNGQYIALVLTGALGIYSAVQEGRPWWLMLGLLGTLAILYRFWPKRWPHLFMAMQTFIVVALVVCHPAFVGLGFVTSIYAFLLFPGRAGVFWVALLTLGVATPFVRRDDLASALLMMLCIGSGYGGTGYAWYAQRRAEAAHRESRALLEELQEAHCQLQAYAEQVEELVVAEERNRLAREMHDALGHRLTVAVVQLEGAQRLIPGDPERASRMVGTVRDQVREALSELRRTVATLRAPPEADLSLPQALARLAAGFEEATGLTVHPSLPGDMPALPDTHRLALYRAAQEALTNVQRYARAHNVWLQLTRQDGMVTLMVGDDGIGFPAAAEQRGFGLRGLAERAARLGGELILDSMPGGGASLSFRLPLPVEESRD